MMKISFVDLKSQYNSIKSEIDQAINDVLSETSFIGGAYVKKFKDEFQNLYGAKYCVPVANGTDAIYIVLKMLGIKEGDEVITTSNSWISTSETISQCGATPIFVDIENDYYTIDVNKIREKITKNTKAIIPVHLYGQVADMQALTNLCNEFDLHLIEDCAQSHFSEFDNKRAGLFGIASTFSFYPGKNLGAYGDAGCIITDSEELANKCIMFSNHGALIKHNHIIEGINSRLDGLQASILLAKLPYILKWTEQRISIANKYNALLDGVGDLILPKVRPNSKHTFHLYVIKTQFRDKLKKYLEDNGIETSIHYPVSLPLMPAYKRFNFSEIDFPNGARHTKEILSLPMYPELNDLQLEYIVNTIISFYENLDG